MATRGSCEFTEMPEEVALLGRFAGLASLPRVSLVRATPIEPLAPRGVPAGALFVKRDDISCALYGGNKPRKLEFVLGAARARGSRRIVTVGALGTHHGLATALLARTQGIATSLALVDQPVTDHVRHQLHALAASGAELRYGRNVAGAALQVAWVLARSTLRGERPYWLGAGGSSPLGTVGFVAAAFELAEQIRSGGAPTPAEIYAPVGSGGTVAGLRLGLQLAGLPIPVVGVLVTDLLAPSRPRLARLANATARLLRRADPSVPATRVRAEDFELCTAQIGRGYGSPTAEGHRALERVAEVGVALEDTYTAKCMAEVLARIDDGRGRLPALFWNTYSSIDPPRSADADERSLPAPLRRLLADESAF